MENSSAPTDFKLGKRIFSNSESHEIAQCSKKNRNFILQSIPLMGFGTFSLKDPQNSILNALKIGYRHLDLAENYDNLFQIKTALDKAFLPVELGGLGLAREDIWITMKIAEIKGRNHIRSLLEEIGTEYFDLLMYHYPMELFECKDLLKCSWKLFAKHKDAGNAREIGISNFYSEHLIRLLDICTEFNLVKPFANQILLNPFVYSSEIGLINLCKENNIQLISYSPLGFCYSHMILDNRKLVEISNQLSATSAQVTLAWLMGKGISVIPKSDNSAHQEENFNSISLIESVSIVSHEIDELSTLAETDIIFLATSLDSKDHAKGLKW
jgi:diketogulonate reductase-like aldo/keto reductase